MGVSIIKDLVNYKNLFRLGIAIVLVVAVAALLRFASPTKALDTNTTEPPFEHNSYGYMVGGIPPPPPPPPGITNVSDYISNEGVFTQEVIAASEDSKVELTIDAGTIGLTVEGEPLSEISIIPMEDPPTPPADSNVIGLAYDLGPDGTTFDLSATLTITYDPSEIPEGVSEENLVIAIWVNGEWLELPSTVDTVNHTITAEVSHFTAFTVLAYTRPAAFTTSNLRISHTEIEVGKSVAIHVLVTNTGDLTGSYEVTLKINDTTVATKDLTLAGGDSDTASFIVAKDVAGTYTVNVNGLSGTFTVITEAPTLPVTPEPLPAAFTASGLTISPTEVDIGEEITISVLVANTGDLTGSYEVSLKINDATVVTTDVTLAGGDSQIVTFTTTKDIAGTYTVNVNELPGTFTVKMPVVPIKGVNWWLVSGIIAGIITGVIIISLIISRSARRRTTQI